MLPAGDASTYGLGAADVMQPRRADAQNLHRCGAMTTHAASATNFCVARGKK